MRSTDSGRIGYMRKGLSAAAFSVLLLTFPLGASAQQCAGDCNGDGEVTIDELVLAVNIALGNRQVGDCLAADLNLDFEVTIDELVSAVNAALFGCPATPTASRTAPTTPTPTSTAPATATDTPAVPPVLRESSKSSSIAISDDDRVVVMSNPDDGSVSIFSTVDDTRTARVTTGREPFAVVIHPDNQTAFVANRGDATVVEIDGIGTPGAHVAASVDVGSEPTGLALSPTGAKLFVAEWAEGRVSVIDTATMTVIASIDGLRNPRAVAVTNNGDDSDDDETLVVTEFFGAPNPDVSGCASGSAETCDTGRIGRVLRYAVSDLSAQDPIVFAPFDSGFAPPGVEAGSAALMTSPNQLYAAAVQGQKVYVTSVSASPAAPVQFDANVFPVLYVGDLASGTEDLSNVGTADLAKLADDAAAPGQARFFLQEIVDLDFAGPTDVAYVVSRASDAVERVVYDDMTGIRVGTAAVPQIDLAPGCRAPIGIVVSNGPRAYVNCWLSRALGVVDLNDQALIDTIASTDPPAVGSPEEAVLLGKRFFFTGRGRWSEGGEGYSSCASCHPDGLSDGITWSFPAGPRQSHLPRRIVLARVRAAEAARLQLDRDLRRGARLRAQHARRLRRPRRHHHRARRAVRRPPSGAAGAPAGRRSRTAGEGDPGRARRVHERLGRRRGLPADHPPAARAARPRCRSGAARRARSSVPATAPATAVTAAPAGRCRGASGRLRR